MRVLILTASVGEGHDLPARTLAAQLLAESPTVEVVVADGLEPMGKLVKAISADAGRVVFFRFQWVWDVGFWFFAQARADALAHPDPPDANRRQWARQVDRRGRAGRRSRARTRTRPRCSAGFVAEAGSKYRSARPSRTWPRSTTGPVPGVDVHLITHPESVDEVRRVAGPNARVSCVHGLTAPEFRVPLDAAVARAQLDLPAEGKVVLVSGGGWGVGDVGGAIEEALRLEACAGRLPLRSERFASREAREAVRDSGRVRVEGFTDRMPEWMAAADVLVHSTGGLTVLEALMRGLPAISYGWGRGHVRVNNAAYRRFGLADVVSTRDELLSAIRRALDRGRTSVDGFQSLPSAASVVLAAAEDATSGR